MENEEEIKIMFNNKLIVCKEITRSCHKNGKINSKIFNCDNHIIEKYYYDTGVLKIIVSKFGNILHSYDDKPAVTRYLPSGLIDLQEYYEFGNLHRAKGPAQIVYTPDGKEKAYENWYFRNNKISKSKDKLSLFSI